MGDWCMSLRSGVFVLVLSRMLVPPVRSRLEIGRRGALAFKKRGGRVDPVNKGDGGVGSYLETR